MHNPANVNQQQPPSPPFRESLGLSRRGALVIAIPGLLVFIGTFGLAAYLAIHKHWPGLNNGLAILLAALVPVVALSVIVAAGTIQDLNQLKSGRVRTKQFSAVAIFIAIGVACRLLGVL